MIKSKLPILAVLMFAFAVAIPVSAEGPNITIVAPTVGTTTEMTQTFQITADKPLASAMVQFSMINGNFEDGDLNSWTTGGDAPWVVSSNTLPWINAAKQGGYFAHSPLAGTLEGEGKTSWLERTIETHQTSSLMFWAKAYLRYGNDVVLTMDGVELERFVNADLASWTQKTYQIPPGVHVMRFTYTRNVDQSASYEAFLLDQFRWVNMTVSSQLTVVNGDTTSEASGASTWTSGIMDYRFKVVDLDGNVAYSPVNRMKVFSAPTVYLNGSNPVTANFDTIFSYSDAGAYAFDSIDENVSASITAGPIEGLGALGPNKITYSAVNSNGVVGSATRIINVVDMTPPVITLIGDSATSTEKFGSYADLGASVADNVTGPIALSLATSSDLDINSEGVYSYVYSSADEYGNIGYATRTINVIDTLPPRIFGVVNGANYNAAVTPQFDEGIGMLNDVAFASGTRVDISDRYILTVTDSHGLVTTVSFEVTMTPAIVVSSGGGGGGGGSVSIVYSIPPEPVILPQPKPQVLGVKYGSTSQVATAKITLKPNGTLIRDSQLRVYVIVNRQKKIISSLTELKKYANKKIYNIVDAEAAMYPDWRPYAVNVLLQSVEGKIYLTQKDGTKWYVSTLDEFATYRKLKLYKKVTAANLAYYPNAAEKYVEPVVEVVAKTAVTTANKYAANVLLRSVSGKIYLTLSNGSKYHITSLEELKKYGKLKMYRNISDTILNQYADSATAK